MPTESTSRLFDVSRPVRAGTPVWPGDAPCCIRWTMLRSEGSTVNVAELSMSAHTGTHADGPFHVSDHGVRIGAAPLESYLGPARVVDARGCAMIDGDLLLRELGGGAWPERLLFHTGAWSDPDVFPTAFAAPTPAAAAMLAEAGVRLVGTDAPSVDPFDSRDLPAHNAFGAAGIAIVENLLLDDVPAGDYELIALPLRLEEADASPVRAVLRGL
ncbi:MAG: cyclase family protein [Gemmatimonadetes bacterium]|nr:cyclase family protein [Gemmatimonadota bacterium]